MNSIFGCLMALNGTSIFFVGAALVVAMCVCKKGKSKNTDK